MHAAASHMLDRVLDTIGIEEVIKKIVKTVKIEYI